MCFSASASFGVSAGLAIIGWKTIQSSTAIREKPFAAIPIIFAIQQCVEGILWLSLEHGIEPARSIATYGFTFFSHIFWPVFIPFAIAWMQPNAQRQSLFRALQTIGIIVALLLAFQISRAGITAIALEHMLYLSAENYGWPMMLGYIIATCGSCLCSSIPTIRWFGGLSLIAFAIAYAFYTLAFFSVWCFFAAILSGIIYVHFKHPLPDKQSDLKS